MNDDREQYLDRINVLEQTVQSMQEQLESLYQEKQEAMLHQTTIASLQAMVDSMAAQLSSLYAERESLAPARK